MCVPLHPYGTIPRDDSLPKCQSNIQITDVYEKNIVFRLHHAYMSNIQITDVYEKNIVFRLHHAYMAKHRCNSKDTCGVL